MNIKDIIEIREKKKECERDIKLMDKKLNSRKMISGEMEIVLENRRRELMIEWLYYNELLKMVPPPGTLIVER